MGVGAVLIPAFDLKGAQAAAKAALPFAERFSAQLQVLHVRERYPADHVAEYYWHENVVSQFKEGVKRRAEEIRAAVMTVLDGRDADWMELEGDEFSAYGTRARAADLVVAPSIAFCARSNAGRIIENLVLQCGRPVFFPGEDAAAKTPESYLVGWNGSLEATRAIAIARPLLEAAADVFVVSVGDLGDGVPDAGAVAAGLSRAGINAQGRAVENRGSVTETLRQEAKTSGADTLLLGGYSHARLLERVLGGVTQSVIRKPPLPSILVH